MKPISPDLEKRRVTKGFVASTSEFGNNGAFRVFTPDGVLLNIIVSDGGGWEHVSVWPSRTKRCCTWEEMNWVKELFWEDDETVIQFHPAKKDYVNNHPYCLHLWRPVNQDIPQPPHWMVGVK